MSFRKHFRLGFHVNHKGSSWPAHAGWAMALCVLHLTACSPASPSVTDAVAPATHAVSPSEQSIDNTHPTELPENPHVPRVFIVELIERNEDSFSDLLFESCGALGDELPALEIVDGKLICRDPSAVHSGEQTISAQPVGTLARDCKFFVIHTVHDAGKGRADAGELSNFSKTTWAIPLEFKFHHLPARTTEF
ncbi:MAG TPA: hypothetical protein PKD54_11800 [Pirellulaceae bacterium]|nr:hypothetical protein [Pirellulaceae bacterium]